MLGGNHVAANAAKTDEAKRLVMRGYNRCKALNVSNVIPLVLSAKFSNIREMCVKFCIKVE